MALLFDMAGHESSFVKAEDWHEAVREEIGRTALGVIPILNARSNVSDSRHPDGINPRTIVATGSRARVIAPATHTDLLRYEDATQVDYGVVVDSWRGLRHKSVAAGVVLLRPGRLLKMASTVLPDAVHEKISQRLGITEQGEAYINGKTRHTNVASASGVVHVVNTADMQPLDRTDRAYGTADRTALRVAAAVYRY